MTNENLQELENGIVTKVINSVTDFFAKKEKEVSSEALENSVKNEVANSIKNISEKFEAEKVELKNSFDAEKVELQNKIEELNNEIAGLKVIPTSVQNAVTDPNPTNDKKEVSVWDSVANQFDNFLK